MPILERIWDFLTYFFGNLMGGFERTITSLFGSSNARYIKRLQPKIDAINNLEESFKLLRDEQLIEKTHEFRRRLDAGETLDDLLVEAFAVCREGGQRFLGMRHYDVQLIGGMVLHSGAIAEMVTGEGKTLVATLPAYLNALDGQGRACRHGQRLPGPPRHGMDGAAVHGPGSDGRCDSERHAGARTPGGLRLRHHLRHEQRIWFRLPARQHAAGGPRRRSFPEAISSSRKGRWHYAIIDEVDNILIDEARTPLIISGPAHDDVRKYAEADRIAASADRRTCISRSTKKITRPT